MAKVKITGHASGTGVVTITAPNTSTDRTITLPDGTGTLLDENSSLPAANLTGTIASARLPTSTDLPLAGGTMTGTVAFADNVYATFGTSADLRIKHNGAESVIQDQGSGALYMASNEFKVTNAAITENMIIATENAAVKLFYDNAQKFITTSTGIDVTGGVTASTTIKCGTAEASSGVASDTFAFMGVNTSNNATKHGAVFSSKHADSNILLCGIHDTAFNTLVVKGSGKVGIGTVSPVGPLHVVSEINVGPDSNNRSMYGFNTDRGYFGTVQGGTSYFDTMSLKGGLVGIGTSAPTGILHVSGASPHAKMVNTTWGASSSATSKKTIDNTAGGASYRGMMTELLFTWTQTTSESWIMVRTPQAYADWPGGGWADMKLCWSGYHASNNTMMSWTAVFHNHHGRVFTWSKTGITQVGNGSGSYGTYNYTPAVAFYRQTSSAHGYTNSDAWMRNLFIKVSGNSASNVCSQRSLYINGLSGGYEYEVIHMGTSTPGGGLTGV